MQKFEQLLTVNYILLISILMKDYGNGSDFFKSQNPSELETLYLLI